MNRDSIKIKRVHTAVIPAAGFGTRFLPASKAVPKEMIPLVDKPVIQYVVEEAAEVWMASEHEDRERAAEEISQLLYHLQVMMIAKKLTLEDVYRYL